MTSNDRPRIIECLLLACEVLWEIQPDEDDRRLRLAFEIGR